MASWVEVSEEKSVIHWRLQSGTTASSSSSKARGAASESVNVHPFFCPSMQPPPVILRFRSLSRHDGNQRKGRSFPLPLAPGVFNSARARKGQQCFFYISARKFTNAYPSYLTNLTNAEKSFQKQLQWRLSLFTVIPKTRDVAKILPEAGMPLPKADTEMAKSRNHLPRNSLKLPLQVLPKPPSVTHHLLTSSCVGEIALFHVQPG